MAQKTDAQLLVETNLIADETTANANTAERVGDTLTDIVDSKVSIGDAETITGAKTFGENKLKIANTSNGNVANMSYDDTAGDDTQIIIPLGEDDGGGSYVATLQTKELLSSNITTDTGSTTKYPSVDAVQDYVTANFGVKTKKYVALISQTGTSAPTATVIYSNFVGAISLSRVGVGDYRATSANSEFVNNKTSFAINNSTNYAAKFTGAAYANTSVVNFATFNTSSVATDGILLNDILEIEVYP